MNATSVQNSMLRAGQTVLTERGPVLLEGRNGCRREIWIGVPVVDGKPQRRRCRLLTGRDVQAVKTDCGFQTVLPGTTM